MRKFIWDANFYKILTEEFRVSKESPSGLIHNKDKFTGKNATVLLVRKGDFAGTVLTTKGGQKYWQVTYKRHPIRAHRVVWFLEKGSICEERVINHINCNGLDNRIENLELVPPIANSQRTSQHVLGRLTKRNSSGLLCISNIKLLNGSKTKYNYYVEASVVIGCQKFRKKFKYEEDDILSKQLATEKAISWRMEILKSKSTDVDFYYRLEEV